MELNTREMSRLNIPGAFSAKLQAGNDGNGYYSHLNLPGFWQIEQGRSTRISDKGSPGPFNQWQLATSGIYYVASYQVTSDERSIIITRARNVSSDIWSAKLE